MAFHASAQDIRVDDGHILRARLSNSGGDQVDAEIDLNQFIGNDNGMLAMLSFLNETITHHQKGSFQWGGENFSHSAEDITFALEGDGVPILRAGLRNLDGNLEYRDINLAERVGNNDGSFYFGEDIACTVLRQ